MLDFITRKLLIRLEEQGQQDVRYLLFMQEHSPKRLRAFLKAARISNLHQSVPSDMAMTVQLVAVLFEACGSCLQLVVQLAEKANMPTHQLRAVVRQDVQAMNAEVALAYRYAVSVLTVSDTQDTERAQVIGRLGNSGLIDLALAMQSVRLYPMLKKALGYAVACEPVVLDGELIKPRLCTNG